VQKTADAARPILARPIVDDVWPRAIEMIRSRQYQQAASLLDQARRGRTVVAQEIVGAAQQICLACDRFLQETRLLAHATQLAADQERDMQSHLVALLHQALAPVGPAPAALGPPAGRDEALAPDVPVERGLWQRLHHLLSVREGLLPDDHPAGDAPALAQADPPRGPAILAFCLGPFRFYAADRPIDDWPNRRGKAILKYLLLHRAQPVRRDVLMDTFWPDHDPGAARNNLNVALYGLRQTLRRAQGHPSAAPPAILFQDESYRLHPALGVWLDVEEFQRRAAAATKAMRRGHLPEAVRDYEAAVELYQGDLLEEDVYEAWLDSPRRALRESYINALTFLAGYTYEVGQDAACVGYGRKLLAVEPADEGTHRRLMRAYARQNQRYLAIRQFQLCVEALREHLDVGPDGATVRLYEAILHNNNQ